MDNITRESSPVIYSEPGALLCHFAGVCSVWMSMPICLGFRPSRRLSALPVAPLLGLPSWQVRLGPLPFLDAPVCQGLSSGSLLAGPSFGVHLAVSRSNWWVEAGGLLGQ